MSLKRDYLWTLSGSAVQVLFIFLAQVILARVLGTEGRGMYAVCWTFLNVLLMLAMCGTDASLTYHVASSSISLGQALGVSLILGTAGSVLAAVFGVALSALPLAFFDKATRLQFAYASLGVSAFLFYTYAVALLRGLMRYRAMNAAMVLSPILSVVFTLLFCVVFRFGVSGAIWGTSLAPLCIAVLVFVFVARGLRLSELGGAMAAIRGVVGYGLRAYMSYFTQVMNLQLGVLIAGFFLAREDIAFFSVGMAMVARIWMIPNALYLVVMPRMAKQAGTCGNSLCRPMRIMLLAVIGASLLVAVVAEPFVRIAFGEAFLPVVNVIYWLLVGVVFRAETKVVTAYFLATDRPGMNSVLKLLGLAVSVICLLVFVPLYGLAGAAIGTSLGYILETVVMLVVFYRVGGIHSWTALVPQRKDFGAFAEVPTALWNRWRRLRAGETGKVTQ